MLFSWFLMSDMHFMTDGTGVDLEPGITADLDEALDMLKCGSEAAVDDLPLAVQQLQVRNKSFGGA